MSFCTDTMQRLLKHAMRSCFCCLLWVLAVRAIHAALHVTASVDNIAVDVVRKEQRQQIAAQTLASRALFLVLFVFLHVACGTSHT
jgi:hypothetical protein